MRLAEPYMLLVLLLVLPLVLRELWRRRRGVRLPSLMVASTISGGPWVALRWLPLILRVASLTLLAIALARPQSETNRQRRTSEGIDIVLVVDTSRSMEARDFVIDGERPSRLTVIKKVIADFIGKRLDDRIGMVIFGTESFTQAPLTLDHQVLLRFLQNVRIGVAGDATAIGDGLATALNRLKDVESPSKVVILLTDGANTAGRVDPLAATAVAKTLGIRVYTIGVGSDGVVPILIDGQVRAQKVDIDEDLMRKIATETGAQYYRATDTESLVHVYETIDKLEKAPVTVETYERRQELFHGFVAWGLALLVLEAGLSLSRFRSLS